MSNTFSLTEGEPEGDLQWLYDTPSGSDDWFVASSIVAAVELPTPEEDPPVWAVVVEVDNCTAQVWAETEVCVAVVDWDEIHAGCRESLYRSYEQVHALPGAVPEREDVLDEMDTILEGCPEEEVFGLHALVKGSEASNTQPGILVTVHQGVSFEHGHRAEVHWVDWDILGLEASPEELQDIQQMAEALPESFPGRTHLLQRCRDAAS